MKSSFFVNELNSNPNLHWVAVIHLILQKATHVEFTIIDNSRNSVLEKVIKIQSNYTYSKGNIRWHNKQISNFNFIKLSIDNNIKEVLFQLDFFNDWYLYDLQDPVFYLNDQILLWMISHERICFFDTNYKINELTDIGIKTNNIVTYEI